MKSKSLKSRIPILLLGIAIVSGAFAAQANEKTFVYVNGYELSPQELYVAQQRSGAHIPPGNYLYDGQSGCWVELNTGQGGCPGNASNGNSGGGSYISRYGSGEWNGNGDWNHWSDAAGGAVGGTSDGCIYTSFGYSNC